MSTQRQASAGLGTPPRDTAPGELSGWATFAGFMLGLTALLNLIYGAAAIDNANFYVHDARYVLSGLNAWGWILVVLGVVQICAAVALFGGRQWGRWVAVATASLNAIGQLLFLPSAPFLALAVFAIDILIIYGMLARWEY